MPRKKKSAPIPVVVEGIQIGSIRLRYRTWQFRFRSGPRHFDITLRGVRDTREALRRAEVEYERHRAPAPSPIAPRKPKTLGEAAEAYEEAYRAEFKKSSADRTFPSVHTFVTLVGPYRPPYVITRAYLMRLRASLLERINREEITPATANITLKCVKAFINWMRAEGLIDENPTLKVKRFKVHTVARSAPSPEAVARLLEQLAGTWLEDFAILLANVGLRPSEALHLRACDLDEETRLLHIRAWKDEHTTWTVKDYEFRKLLLNPIAYEAALRRKRLAKRPQDLLFPNSQGRPLEYHNFKRQHWKPAAKGAGIAPYDLRHYFGTQAALTGWRNKQEKLRRYMGHRYLATTMEYYADTSALTEVGAPPILTPTEGDRKEKADDWKIIADPA